MPGGAPAFFALLLWLAACEEPSSSKPASNACLNTSTANDAVLVDVTYETNTTDSGISGLTSTKAAANDAAYLVSPGRSGSYAIAHKVDRTNSDYFSAGAYRSESDTVNLADKASGRFAVGDERRYEFSVLLKDWQEWKAGETAYGDNIFQLKVSDDVGEPARILAKRNSIVVRRAASQAEAAAGNTAPQDVLVADFLPYVNQWIDFRIDVLFADTETGCMAMYVRLPGESDYTLALRKDNYRTYPGTSKNVGYVKWGVYREAKDTSNDAPVTRIAYHDDIRIIRR